MTKLEEGPRAQNLPREREVRIPAGRVALGGAILSFRILPMVSSYLLMEVAAAGTAPETAMSHKSYNGLAWQRS